MVERVAEVIASGHGYDLPSDVIARAVIEALMEPTPEMVDAALYLLYGAMKTDADDRAEVADTYKTMLRAALSQPNEEGEGK